MNAAPPQRRNLNAVRATVVALLAAAAASATASDGGQALECSASGCRAGDVELLSVDVSQPLADETGRAAPIADEAAARTTLELPGGGSIWAVEDPAAGAPALNVSAPAMIAVENGRVTQSVDFHFYSNYAAFVQRHVLELYRGSDNDLVEPLAVLEAQAVNVGTIRWTGEVPQGQTLHEGDDLIYVLRAFDRNGRMDETEPRRVRLARHGDVARGLTDLRDRAEGALREQSLEQLESGLLAKQAFAGNSLRRQNIPVYGSRIRLVGTRLPAGVLLKIGGQSYPVDREGQFAADFLLPVGSHRFDISIENDGGKIERTLDVEVSGRHLFLIAIADFTASGGDVDGSIEPLGPEDRFDDFLTEGRVAFYLKGKIKGKYLITAQADTEERKLSRLFDGFFREDPRDIFRRLDPDRYYPVYGDDSATYRDVDSQGRLYLRIDWDKNQILWGNFSTGLTGSEFTQYVRSLYGAAVAWRSQDTTGLGDARTQARAFASQAENAPGHSEFVGTGGSLYYLHDTDILPGSDQVTIERVDRTTGRVVDRVPLQRGVDYEVDELQGRIILAQPLPEVTRESFPSLTRDRPLDGFENRLLVDYEFIPSGFGADKLTMGFSGKRWFGEHVAVGGTYAEENRNGEDFRLMGVDLTLQAGRGSYLKIEQSRTESTSAPVFLSDNGGLSFNRVNDRSGSRDGDATNVEAHLNLREMGLGERDWSLGGWWREVDRGYSIARFDTGRKVEEQGVEFSGELSGDLRLNGRYSDARLGDEGLEQAQLQLQWRQDEHAMLSTELRTVTETRGGAQADGALAALRYDRRIRDSLDVYGVGQLTLADDGGEFADNDAVTFGSRYLFSGRSSVGGEYTTGDRGDSATLNGEYELSPGRTLYGGYTYSTDSTTLPILGREAPQGLTLGQRWRISNSTNLYNESQFLRSGPESGIAHTFGMDFYPGESWNLGFSLQDGELVGPSGTVDRHAVSVSGGRTTAVTTWASKLEYRRDTGAERRRQWVTTHRFLHRLNESWRIAARFNYADTEDRVDSLADARFIESNLGIAYRPVDNTRWALLGKYTFLYDLAALGQDSSDSRFDQRSHILALEGTYRFDRRLEFAGKLAYRSGQARVGRGTGAWFDSDTRFAAAQVRYELLLAWSALGEYRWLDVEGGGLRHGWLVGLDRAIGDNLRVGAGYNFTEFSDDLTRIGFDYQGWFFNVVGSY